MGNVLPWVALAMTGSVGGKTITRLLNRFGSLEAALAAPYEDLLAVKGIGEATASAITGIDLAAIEEALAYYKEQNIRMITWDDTASYPDNLLRCQNAPPVLFMTGETTKHDSRAVAVIGTRTPRPESRDLACEFGFQLGSRGWTIVSGLALGIDAAAHQGALDARGRTLAVLGSGLLRLYPPENKPLADQIASQGAVISELKPEAQVSSQTLIARNRITSGLSRAVIVVQSGEDSGSMSTARRAVQQGRRVFAVVGGDSGCERLIADGAEAVDPDSIGWDKFSDRLDRLSIDSPPDPQQAQLRLF
jgi:DNA processing protein